MKNKQPCNICGCETKGKPVVFTRLSIRLCISCAERQGDFDRFQDEDEDEIDFSSAANFHEECGDR